MSRIVEMKDEGPLVIKKDEMEGDVVAACRCGLSGDWPYCDGSHAKAAGEPDDELVRYNREDGELVRLESDVAPGEADPRT